MMIHGTMNTSSKKDYLSILGLSYDFDDNELKKAFRREARKWHPDLNKNDLNAEERFKLINEAYEFLRDPNKRNYSSDEKIQRQDEINSFTKGFPDFQDYLNSLFGYQYDSNNIQDSNYPFNEESINILVQQAFLQASMGCDVIAPSDMMDGRIGKIRKALDKNNFSNVRIFKKLVHSNSEVDGMLSLC